MWRTLLADPLAEACKANHNPPKSRDGADASAAGAVPAGYKKQADIESNYSSFAENSEERERLVREGHIEEIGTWADVCARWPGAVGRHLRLIGLVQHAVDLDLPFGRSVGGAAGAPGAAAAAGGTTP